MRRDYTYDVFISYYHGDEKQVQPIYQRLCDYGLRVFWAPVTLPHGKEFPEELAKATLSSQHFVVYWTQSTSQSRWVSTECRIFYGQCHNVDPENRRMYVLLQGDCGPNDLPGLYRELNCSTSEEGLVKEIVNTVMNRSTLEFDDAIEKQKTRIAELEQELKEERKKVTEAQSYYRHNRFWGPISKNRDIHIFTCARNVPYDPETMRGTKREQGGRTNMDMWDYRAVIDITQFFASNYPNSQVTIEDPMSKLQGTDLRNSVSLADHMTELGNMLENKDCIIIGSPDVSDFAELVLAKIHKITPYTGERVKSKGFVIIKDQLAQSSCYWQKDETKGEKEGIAQILGPKKYDPFAHRVAVENGEPGRMHGILVVANNPFGKGGDRRKIIILSGFSGVATDAIAKLLTAEECLPEFLKLDSAYADMKRDIEALVGVQYVVEPGFPERDTRQIFRLPDSRYAITFEKLVLI